MPVWAAGRSPDRPVRLHCPCLLPTRCNALTTRQLPEGRYGPTRRPLPRWGRWALLGTALAAAVAVTVVVWQNVGDPDVQGERLGFDIVDDSTIELRFEVSREDSDRPAVCIVHAQSLDARETGRREVLIAPADGDVRVDTLIRTSQPPVTADVVGCSLTVPEYLRTG